MPDLYRERDEQNERDARREEYLRQLDHAPLPPPKITALAPWFGAKRALSAQVVSEFGDHRVYWEPFCGSMAVLLAKPLAPMETVNDLHADLVNLGRVIQSDGARLFRALRRTFVSEEIKAEATASLKSETAPFARAYWYFLDSWLGRNGVSGTQSTNNGFCRRFTGNGGAAPKRFSSAVESIPAFQRRLRNVMILSADAFDLLAKIDDAAGTVIYCDPPYVTKGAKYVHDFAGEADHRRLHGALARFKLARVVVSYYEHPLLDSLYGGWTKRRLTATKALVNQGMRDRDAPPVKAPEILLINGPSLVTDDQPA